MNNQIDKDVKVVKKTEPAIKTAISVAIISAVVGGIGIIGYFALAPARNTNTKCLADGACTGTISAPGSFSLSSPLNGVVDQDDDVTLVWTASSGATSYDVYYYYSSQAELFPKASVTATVYTARDLKPGTNYVWYVIAKNSAGTRTSSTWNLTTAKISFFKAQPFDPSNPKTLYPKPQTASACGGQQACDADSMKLNCTEFNNIWLLCSGVDNKCPSNLEEKCIQQTICACASGVATDGPSCTNYLNTLTDPCL